MDSFLSRLLTSMAAAVAAIILVAAAAVFLCVALYLFLVSMSVAPPLAAVLVGLALLMLAGLIILAARMTPRFRRTPRPSGNPSSAASGPAGNINDLAAQLGGLAADQLTGQAQAHPYRTFAVALMAGVAVGGSPELRKIINKILNT